MADPTKDEQAALDLVTAKFKRMNERHEQRCDRYMKRYNAWTGVLERKDDEWMSQLAPKWAFQKLDVLMAHLVDAMPTGKVTPLQPGEDVETASRLMQKALNEFRRKDGREYKNYPFVQQALVMGLSPAKVSWKYEHVTKKYVNWQSDMMGKLVGVEATKQECLWDQPTFTVIPVNDFMWDNSATRIEDAMDCIHRTWQTIDTLRYMQANGVYKNVDQIEGMRFGNTASDALSTSLSMDRKGRIEVMEYWQRNRLITVANRKVVLQDRDNPYWHQKLPFVVGTTLPDIYRLDGFSEIELLAELQAACWEFLNQKIDNARFISNAMLIIQGDFDPEKIRMQPGGYIEVNATDQITPWTPPLSVVQPLVQAEQDLRQVMDDISGVTPYISGAGTEGIDPQTATLVNTMQNMAARRVESKRNRLYTAYREAGIQEIQLIQQLMDKPMALRLDSQQGMEWQAVEPWQISDADLTYEIDESNESINRQERRAEAQQLWATAVASPPGVVQWNYMQLAKDLVEAFDKPNSDDYVSEPPPPMPALPAATGGQGANGAAGPPPALANGPAANTISGMIANANNPSYAGNPANGAPAGP